MRRQTADGGRRKAEGDSSLKVGTITLANGKKEYFLYYRWFGFTRYVGYVYSWLDRFHTSFFRFEAITYNSLYAIKRVIERIAEIENKKAARLNFVKDNKIIAWDYKDVFQS